MEIISLYDIIYYNVASATWLQRERTYFACGEESFFLCMHKIIVCVKQVPDTTQIRLNPETKTLVRDGVENILNPYDAEALETALILKDKYGAKVTVVTMGPPQAKDILKDAIALGADEAYLLTDRVVAGSDTLATSMALAALVKNLGEYDLILCGREAADGCTAQVGPEMAEHLGIPQVTSALKVEFTDGRFVVERETENWAETLAVPAPLLVTMTRAEKPGDHDPCGKRAALCQHPRQNESPQDGDSCQDRGRPGTGCHQRRPESFPDTCYQSIYAGSA